MVIFTKEMYTVLATAKLTSFSFLLKNEDAFLRERKRIFQKTKTYISENEDAKKNEKAKQNNKKKKRKRIKRRREKTHLSWGIIQKSADYNSSFIYKKYLDCFWK